MKNDKDIFLKRMFEYKIQYAIAIVTALILWYGIFVFGCFLEYKEIVAKHTYSITFMAAAPFFIFSLFNTVTYFYSKYLMKKYGSDLFGDLDQNWLREFQGFDSSAFGEIFTRLIQCRKIAGPYMLAVIAVTSLIHTLFAAFVGLVYIIAYVFYRQTYLDIAIADKVPRSMGGGVVVSRIIDREFTDKIDQLSKNLEQAKKK